MLTSRVSRPLYAVLFAVSLSLCIQFKTLAQEPSGEQPAPPAEAAIQEKQTLTKEQAELGRLIDLSYSLYQQGKTDEAIAEAERGLHYAEQNFASDDPFFGAALLNLGRYLIAKGNLARAEPLQLRAIEILEQHLGPRFNQGASLSDLADAFQSRGDTAGAIRIYTLALKAMEREVGPDDLEVARVLNSLGAVYRKHGDYKQSALTYQRALEIQDNKPGTNQTEIGWTLNRLAGVLRMLEDYEQAEQHYSRALKIFEAAEGPRSLNTAIVSDNLGLVYMDKGDLERAEQAHQRALEVFEKELGAENPDVATALSNLAAVALDKEDDKRAEELYKRAIAIREKTLAADHPATATAIDNLAVLYQRMGNYAAAEKLHQKAVVIIEKAYGPEHPYTAEFISNLAGFYRNMGDYVKAERLFRRALAVNEKTYGKIHRRVASGLNNLANLSAQKADYVDAILTYRQALAVALEALGPDNILVATILDGLADMYGKIGYEAIHNKMHERAMAIRMNIYGSDDPTLLFSYGNFYLREGNFAKAEKFLLMALKREIEKYGNDHPLIANELEVLAALYHIQGRDNYADQLYRRLLMIQEKQVGLNHPDVGHTYFHLSVLHWAKGDIPESLRLLSRATDIFEHNLASVLTTGSEKQKSFYMTATTPSTSAAITLNIRSAPRSVEATRLALTTILRRKGRSLDAMTDQIGTLRRRLNPQGQTLFDQLKKARARLAALAHKDVERIDPAQYRAEIIKLEDEVERLEAQVSSHSEEFREQSQPITIERVQQFIPPEAALVEIFSYDFYKAKHKHNEELYGAEHYVAYVLRREGQPVFINLGPTKSIDGLVVRLRTALSNRSSINVKQAARALDEMVMRPVRKLLGDKRLVLLSPDGALNLVPFSALVDEQGKYLVENYTFTYLTSGRDLLRLTAQTKERQGAVIIANPAFDQAIAESPGSTPAMSDAPDLQRWTDFTKKIIKPLPNTAEEANDLKRILPDARVLTERQATEAALKQLVGPRLLHIATHGFFQSKETRARSSLSKKAEVRLPQNRRKRKLIMDEPSPTAGVLELRPLLRSGLVLAGVKKRQSGAGEDGVLTALEVAGLDLWGTELVVLSACDTGVGDVEDGNGVYGLRRALVLAGAESELMSLWPVSDVATRHLMVAYYQRLHEGVSRAESLRQVQLELLRSTQRNHPFYWASFIPVGDWRNMKASRANIP